MKKYPYMIVILALLLARVSGQDHPAIPPVEPYGKVDKADLERTSCDFEKNANAEILFDVAKMSDGLMERHIRIKIFNNFGMGWANFRLEYSEGAVIYGQKELKGQTFNLVNGNVEITPLEKKQIYVEKTNKYTSTLVFAFPNVKPGSIIEFVSKGYFGGTWYFQNRIPTRYSEIQTDFPSNALTSFKFVPYVTLPYVKDIGANNAYNQTKAMAYVPSLPKEPFVSSPTSGLQRLEFMGIINVYGSWQAIGEVLSRLYKFGQNTDVHLSGEQSVIDAAKSLKSDDEKIAYIFNYVKNQMAWNKITDVYPEESTAWAWDKRTGSTSEINWIVLHLLKKAGIKSYPLITSNRETGKMNPGLPDIGKIRNMAVLIPVDSATNYVLDASDKLNTYNVIPEKFLNLFGLLIDRDNEAYNMVFLGTDKPVIQQAFFDMEVKPEGKITGTGEITSDSYNKYAAEKNYSILGEKLYVDSLRGKNNTLKVTSFKLENMDTDTLPLSQKLNFSQELIGGDEHYLYFDANPFALIGENPFKSENRFCDIDFGYRQDFSISCMYKIPDGYKIETLPKSITSFMPDKSILFKRMVAEDNGKILIRYTLDHRKSIYFAKDYADIRAFYRSMYDMLAEQVVLKKS